MNGFNNPKARGSKARLTNGNPLAFNQYKLRQRSDLMQANTNEGSFDYKLAPNPKNAPPNSNSQGTLNGQLKYWKGQKLSKIRKSGILYFFPNMFGMLPPVE